MGIPQPHLLHFKWFWLYLKNTCNCPSWLMLPTDRKAGVFALINVPSVANKLRHTTELWFYRGGQEARFVGRHCCLTAYSSSMSKRWTMARVLMSFDEHTCSIIHRNAHSLLSGAIRCNNLLKDSIRQKEVQAEGDIQQTSYQLNALNREQSNRDIYLLI